jgi:hypothetical protein
MKEIFKTTVIAIHLPLAITLEILRIYAQINPLTMSYYITDTPTTILLNSFFGWILLHGIHQTLYGTFITYILACFL